MMSVESEHDPAASHSASLDLGTSSFASAAAYRVLARKYRPSTFADLIGQEAMVRTLSNAFDLGRIHQAYVLTGVRGVGKTTTARILARAFNYEIPGSVERPTIHMPVEGVHCRAIIESRHMDVIEMDAASHTGIDDVRDIIDGARYRPVSARTKVYIIDEVHMLSKQAFNGLLKTLEEPPEHVKFVFATTEIDKVPVTVRSRCLRFDLRRIEETVLVRHLAGICAKEGVTIEEAALALIARAAEGSVRDALSLLDQAIAHGAERGSGGIEAAAVRGMLGLADRSRVIDLFEAVMRGDIAAALALLKTQHDLGADPASVLSELAELVHFVTRLKLAPEAAKDPGITEQERERGKRFAATLPIRILTRAWQILLKGLQDLKDTPRPLAAADMVLVRLAFAADLPTPDEAIRALLRGGADGQQVATPAAATQGTSPVAARASPAAGVRQTARAAPAPVPAPSTTPEPEPQVRLTSLAEAVAMAEAKRDIQLKMALERDVRLVRFEPGRIEFSLAPGGSPQLASTLARKLQDWTGVRWMVAISTAEGAPSLREQAAARDQEHRIGVQADPLVRSVMERFPGAQIVAVRSNAPQAAEPVPSPAATSDDGDADIVYTDDLITENDL